MQKKAHIARGNRRARHLQFHLASDQTAAKSTYFALQRTKVEPWHAELQPIDNYNTIAHTDCHPLSIEAAAKQTRSQFTQTPVRWQINGQRGKWR